MLPVDDPRSERSDLRYAGLDPSDVPLTECLKDTVARVMPSRIARSGVTTTPSTIVNTL